MRAAAGAASFTAKFWTWYKKNNIDAEVIKTEDIKEIMKYGIMMTPGLVINEKVVCSVNVPTEKEIIKYIEENL